MARKFETNAPATVQIRFFLDEKNGKKLEAAASKVGLPVATYMRILALQAIDNPLKITREKAS